MQVYKLFFRILNKQKGQIIMYLGIFMGIALLVSSQGKESGSISFEPESYQFAVFDEDNSTMSKALIQYLEQANERVEIADGKESIQDEIYNRNVHCVLRIPENFGVSLEQEKAPAPIEIIGVPGTIYKQTFETSITQYLTTLQGYLVGGFSEDEAIRKASEKKDSEVAVKVEGGASTEHSNLYFFFAYVPYILLSLCIVGISPVLIVFHKKEVKERIQCSSYSLMKMNQELILGTLTAGGVFGILFLICTFLANGGDLMNDKGVLYAANTFAFLFVSLSIVFLLGQCLKKTTSISMVSNVLALGMSFLTGVFVPMEFLGDGIIRLAHFLPSYWYIKGVRYIDSGMGEGLLPLWQYMGIQIVFALAILAVGLAYSKAKTAGVSFSIKKAASTS